MNRNFVFGVIMAIFAIILIVFSIVGFSAGVGWTAWLWLITGSFDGIYAISNFCYWWNWRRQMKWIKESK